MVVVVHDLPRCSPSSLWKRQLHILLYLSSLFFTTAFLTHDALSIPTVAAHLHPIIPLPTDNAPKDREKGEARQGRRRLVTPAPRPPVSLLTPSRGGESPVRPR